MLSSSLLATSLVVAAVLFAATDAANCTSTEKAAIATLDAAIENAPECARLNSLVAGEATLVQICSDAECIKIVKKAATSAPDCIVDGEDAKRLSLTAFASCEAPDTNATSTTKAPTPTPTPEPMTVPSAGSVGGDSDAKTPMAGSTPASTTKSPDSAANSLASSVVVITSTAALLYAAWM